MEALALDEPLEEEEEEEALKGVVDVDFVVGVRWHDHFHDGLKVRSAPHDLFFSRLDFLDICVDIFSVELLSFLYCVQHRWEDWSHRARGRGLFS